MKNIAVIGSGSWGTALACVLADNKHNVRMHTINKTVCDEINTRNTNEKYLPGIQLSKNIKCSLDYDYVLKEATLVLLVVPSHAMRETARTIKPYITEETLVVHATKGIEIESSKTMSVILRDELDNYKDIVVLSGPSHAEEVSRKIPTTVVSACKEITFAKEVQKLFNNEYFRVYTNHDVVGVELGGALKNIIALGAGISDGLGYGDNGRAALLTRGLTEIKRLGIKLGAEPETFSGLTGIGDLIVTGTSKHSRNWRTGYMLSQGVSLEEALYKLGMVAEGVKTTKSAYLLAQKENVEIPIISAIYQVLFEGKHPKEATLDLMNRAHKNE